MRNQRSWLDRRTVTPQDITATINRTVSTDRRRVKLCHKTSVKRTSPALILMILSAMAVIAVPVFKLSIKSLTVTVLILWQTGNHLKSSGRIDGYLELVLRLSGFGRYQHHSIGGTRTIQSGGIGSFQHGYAFNIVSIQFAGTVSIINLLRRTGKIGVYIVIDRNSINDIQRLVIV